jgi:hypothetical protein
MLSIKLILLFGVNTYEVYEQKSEGYCSNDLNHNM